MFFRDATRVLASGGRVVMVEPAITWLSSVFYRALHPEPVRTSVEILLDGDPDPRDPYDANQAIPTLLVTRDQERFHAEFPELRITRVDWFSFAAYPLSGGFRPWSLISDKLATRLLRIERAIEPAIGWLAAFRMLVVIEKSTGRGVAAKRLAFFPAWSRHHWFFAALLPQPIG